ncbi:multidrug efflux SMR transporter [soil metagenome]
MIWLILGGAILCEVSGTLAMRASEGFTRLGWLGVTLVGYLISFTLLAQVLKMGMPVGIAYGIWAACGVALTAVAGKVLWDDPLTPVMGVGIVLIIGGVLLVELGSHPPS